jgi:hypothetical protein
LLNRRFSGSLFAFIRVIRGQTFGCGFAALGFTTPEKREQ